MQIYTMEGMYLQKESWAIHGFGRTIPIMLTCPDGTECFRGNDVAEFLGYKQPAIAITKHVCERHTKTLRETFEKGVYSFINPFKSKQK